MAFCKNCGTDLNGAKFCPGCGMAADGEVAVQQGMGMDVRQRSLMDMENMLQYFGVKQSTYDEFDVMVAEVEERTARSYGGWIGAAVISVLLGIFNEAFFFYVVAVAFVAISILLSKKNKEKLAIAQERVNVLTEELTTYYADYGYCPVGMEYVRPVILHALYDLIRKGRASNPADAINIYLADIQQEEMLQLQREATAAAKETEKASKRTASYTTASFWLKK